MKRNPLKIVQIAVSVMSTDEGDHETLYALDAAGQIWERNWSYETYENEWKAVSLPGDLKT